MRFLQCFKRHLRRSTPSCGNEIVSILRDAGCGRTITKYLSNTCKLGLLNNRRKRFSIRVHPSPGINVGRVGGDAVLARVMGVAFVSAGLYADSPFVVEAAHATINSAAIAAPAAPASL